MTSAGYAAKLRLYEIWLRWTQPRHHLYCIGLPKTGTHSVAGLFSENFAVDHEPGYKELVKLLEYKLSHPKDVEYIKIFLRRRRQRIRLDLESNHLLGPFAAELAHAHPDARFILTVRSPESWLHSMIQEHHRHHAREPMAFWMRAYACYFQTAPIEFPKQERELEALGIYPLRSYLRHYARTHQHILQSVPAQRLFVVPTYALGDCVSQLAQFCGIDASKLNHAKSHLYKSPPEDRILDRVDPEYLSRIISEETDDVTALIEQVAQYPLRADTIASSIDTRQSGA